MSRREHDAVREARDALLVIAVATPPLLVIAVLFGVASSQLEEFLRWVGGTLVMAVVLLVCLASALLAADRVAHHWWNLRPYPLRCIQLIPASLGVGLLLVAGYPTTEPVIVGLVLVAVLMGALVVAAAALDL
jgi:small-conductance mechanosensitive channel